ncbi:MAG: P-loop NTPase [Deltaproteobacteria bacterium]|nr:P-loop NTPase [Deltaproteobacteria bacterium]MCW5804099.1 P-loop NTPase [Deltaproteobacteria bacterium]
MIRGGRRTNPPLEIQRRAIAVSGGKGGVGKSTIALNLAVAYAQAGSRTLMVDTDLGMADLNLLLGVAPERSLLDALGGTPIEDILVAAHGIHLLPALNGSYLLSTIGPAAQAQILEMVKSLATRFDALVIDIAAGIGQTQTAFAGAPTDAIVVVNPEPLSMADAYASLKVLSMEQGVRHAFLVPNRVTSRAQATEVVSRLQALVDRFLDLELTPLPPIPSDPAVAEAAQIGVPLLVHCPDAPAARAIRQLTRALATLAPTTADASWWRSTTRAQGVSP